jgi:hypothetical protein
LAYGPRPPAPRQPDRPAGPSLTGAAGALLAILVLGGIAAAFIADERTATGALFIVLSLCFLPALIVSLVSSPLRTRVLRYSTVFALVVALATAPLDFGIPLVMALPVAVLAQAAGFLFQGRPGR